MSNCCGSTSPDYLLVELACRILQIITGHDVDVRERSEREHQQSLELSIDSIDRGLHSLPGSPVYSLKGLRLGELMIAAGLTDPTNESLRQFSGLRWQGSLKDVARELATLTKERDTATWDLARARD